jgi:hypothetical protein
MGELIAVPLDNGGVIVVEMDHAPGGVVKAGRAGQIVGKAAQTLDAALESVAPAMQSILAKLRQARPQEITVELGLMLTAEAGVVIAKTESGCHLKVTLHWDRDRDDDAAG